MPKACSSQLPRAPLLVKSDFAAAPPYLILSLTPLLSCSLLKVHASVLFSSVQTVTFERCAKTDLYGQFLLELPVPAIGETISSVTVLITIGRSSQCECVQTLECTFHNQESLCAAIPVTTIDVTGSLLVCVDGNVRQGPIMCDNPSGALSTSDALLVCNAEERIIARNVINTGSSIQCEGSADEFVLVSGGAYVRRSIPNAGEAYTDQDLLIACDPLDGQLKLFGSDAQPPSLCKMHSTQSTPVFFPLVVASGGTVSATSVESILSFTGVSSDPVACIIPSGTTADGFQTFQVTNSGLYRLTAAFNYKATQTCFDLNTFPPNSIALSSVYVMGGFSINGSKVLLGIQSSGYRLNYERGRKINTTSSFADSNRFDQVRSVVVVALTAGDTIEFVAGHRMIVEGTNGAAAAVVLYHPRLDNGEMDGLRPFDDQTVPSTLLIEQLQ